MSSEAVKAFGREVRRRRLAANMTLEALAERALFSSPQYLGDVETGKRRRGLSLDAALRLANGLGVELPELLGFKGLPGAGLEAARLVSTLRPTLRRAVLSLLLGLAKEEGACSDS